MSTLEELQRHTKYVQEIAQAMIPSSEAAHKYFGNTTPYRWEVRNAECGWVATVALDGPEISSLYAMSEAEQRAFLLFKLLAAIADA